MKIFLIYAPAEAITFHSVERPRNGLGASLLLAVLHKSIGSKSLDRCKKAGVKFSDLFL